MTGPCSCHGGTHLSAEAKAELVKIAEQIATPGKGITACDEGPATIGSRLEPVGVENSEESRRIYRQMLFETEGADKYLSAAILDPETMFQKNDKGVPFPEALTARGILPGFKPHLKVYELPGTGGDTVMQGLDSLAVRCREMKAAGATFAKWRSPLKITGTAPTDLAIEANMRDLARYALICQDEGLVPIVEPDIVMAGTHDLDTAASLRHHCFEATLRHPTKHCAIGVQLDVDSASCRVPAAHHALLVGHTSAAARPGRAHAVRGLAACRCGCSDIGQPHSIAYIGEDGRSEDNGAA